MFELSIAKKYLVPKRKQLSVALISLMSVSVISLVVWLVLVFLSVTDGIERSWLQKLTTLNGPVRITPTPAYFSSYYYQIDNFSAASNYAPRSLAQKAAAERSDPYDAESDMALPARFPKPERDAEGQLLDPVKQAALILQKRKLAFQEYELGGAMLRLHMVRAGPNIAGQGGLPGGQRQSFLTQVAYVSSLCDRNPYLSDLVIEPSAEDVQNLFSLSVYDLQNTQENGSLPGVSEKILQARVKALFNQFTVDKLATGGPGGLAEQTRWALPRNLLPERFSCPVQAYVHGEGHGARVIAINFLSDKLAAKATFTRESSKWQVKTEAGQILAVNEMVPLFVEESLTFQASLLPSSLPRLRSLGDVVFHIEGQLCTIPLKGEIPWEGLKIAGARPHLSSLANTASLPIDDKFASPVFLPKQFQEGGVKLGDRGFLSYAASTASSVQEQRLPIYVTGFYDPGIMAIGNKCILAPPGIVHTLNLSNQSFQLDPSFASGIQVWVDPLSSAKQVKQDLEAAFEEAGISQYWKVTTFHDYDFAKDLLLQFQSDKYMFTLVGGIILIVACCNIISLLVLLVNDKKREIGILQAMGARTSSIALIFAACGAGMGIVSSLLGTVAALFTLRHIDSLAHFLSVIQGHDAFNAIFYGKTLPNTLSTDALLFILIATPVLSLLAGLVPALKACRLRPSTILRSES